jgi:hypothetical protein
MGKPHMRPILTLGPTLQETNLRHQFRSPTTQSVRFMNPRMCIFNRPRRCPIHLAMSLQDRFVQFAGLGLW